MTELQPHEPVAEEVETPMLPKCTGKVRFTWENFSYRVRIDGEWKTLLHPCSGTARPGRTLAIMGPSGAGKTTLLNGVLGRLRVDEDHTFEGCVFLNDSVFTARYKKLVSLVAQDDIVMGKETAREALYFACRVRLGLDHKDAERRTNEVLGRLHLTKCADTLLGIPGLIKGVSGGRRSA